MAYPFEHKEHKKYYNTFLDNTAVSLIAPTWDRHVPDEFFAKFPAFVERNYQIKASAQQFIESHELNVENEEEAVTYVFKPDKATLRVGRKTYDTFYTAVMPRLLPLKEFVFGVMGLCTIENLLVRKLNIFPISADSPEEVLQNAENIYRYMYKGGLVEIAEEQNIPQNAPWILSLRKAILSDANSEVTIRIALAKAKGENLYNVILDSSVRYYKLMKIEEGSIDRRLRFLNDLLFDAFHWCVSDSIVELMEKEIKK